MNNEPPHIEQLPATDSYHLPDPDIPGRNLLRLKIFALTFLAIAAVGLIYTFVQPVVYRSQATLLGAGQSAIGREAAVKNAQHIARQHHVLFSDELMASTRARLAAAGYSSLAVGELRRRLNAEAVEGTNMVVIIAEGSDARLLPHIINTWIDVYLEAQTANAEANKEQTEQPIPEGLARLVVKLEQARVDLEEFRKTYEITSTDWDEKEVSAKLDELKRSFKSATQQEEKAKSALSDVQKDIARGKTVIPRDEQRKITKLERILENLETKLADLDQRYTREFLALQPKLRVLPEQIEALKVEIERLKIEGNQNVLDEYGEEYREARQSVSQFQRQIDEHKQRSEYFTSIGAEHSARIKALENLEALNLEARARLTQVGSLRVDEYPQLSLIDRATVSDTPISTDTSRNAIIALSSALAAAVFAVWLYGFLNPAHALNPAQLLAGGETGDSEVEEPPQLTPGFQSPGNEPPPADQGKV
ncbi:MAG: hypothetical protein O7F73_07525 [Gammaproteobacteria bacterium]|nr:hypothetical protein [Gammaproteobacteria bacterium]